jgi:hypothetical protein
LGVRGLAAGGGKVLAAGDKDKVATEQKKNSDGTR